MDPKTFPKIYYINMERSVERNKYMKNLLKDYRSERVDAIDSTKHRVEEFYTGISPRTRAELACVLSHIKAIQQFVNDKSNTDDCAVIAEDDLSFDFVQYWTRPFDKYVSDLPKNWEIFQMTNNINNKYDSYIPWSNTWNCGAYIIKRTTAMKILDKYIVKNAPKFKISIPQNISKLFVSEYAIFSIVQTYTYCPAIFTYRDNNDSSIHPNHLSWHRELKNGVLTVHKKVFGDYSKRYPKKFQ